jgi:hypothetical protein
LLFGGDPKDIGLAIANPPQGVACAIALGLNLTQFATVWQGFKPMPDCGFDRLVDTNETAPTYKQSPIGLVNKKLK